MAFALLTHGSGPSDGSSNNAVTGSIDTTGAALLIVVVSWLAGVTLAVSDSKSNTWHGMTAQASGSAQTRIYWCVPTTVGTGHTFTAATTGGAPGIDAASFSGSVTATPNDQENGAHSDAATTLATGSITPSATGALVIAALGSNSTGSYSIDSGFTIADQRAFAAGQFGGALAYIIETTIVSKNPTWTQGSSTFTAAAIASFSFTAAATSSGGMFQVF